MCFLWVRFAWMKIDLRHGMNSIFLCLHIYIVRVHVFEAFLNCHKHFVTEKWIRMIECKGFHLISYDGIGDGFFVGPLWPLVYLPVKSAMYIIDIYFWTLYILCFKVSFKDSTKIQCLFSCTQNGARIETNICSYSWEPVCLGTKS